MIVVTGAAGFIASCLVAKLNELGMDQLILVDDFTRESKKQNYAGKKYAQLIERNVFLDWFQKNAAQVEFVYHLGARTDTTEFNKSIFDELNVDYSKRLFELCTEHQISLLYASSAATYGLGEHGYNDDHTSVNKLKPLNPYGDSKQVFDEWVLSQQNTPPNWYGIKFFNVYGPNEYHKGRMASVILHATHQMMETGKVKLFRSHHAEYKDGWQLRDFIYVKDVVNVLHFLHSRKSTSGIYNLGTGQARSFYDLAASTFAACQLPPYIEFIDIPADIRDKYQYYTQAEMVKLKSVGYSTPFTSLEDGITDYVTNYLLAKKYY